MDAAPVKMRIGKSTALALSCMLGCLALAPVATAQGMPHAIVGVVIDGDGNAVGGALVTLENARTGQTISTTSDSASGQYQADLSSMSGGYIVGDTIHLEAHLDDREGTAALTVSPEAFDMCNITLGNAAPDDGIDPMLPIGVAIVLLIAAVAAVAIIRKPGKPGEGDGSKKGRRRQR